MRNDLRRSRIQFLATLLCVIALWFTFAEANACGKTGQNPQKVTDLSQSNQPYLLTINLLLPDARSPERARGGSKFLPWLPAPVSAMLDMQQANTKDEFANLSIGGVCGNIPLWLLLRQLLI